MKQFFSDLSHFILGILLKLPIHSLRILLLKSAGMSIGTHSALCRNIDVRSLYRISVGSFFIIN